MISGKPFKYWRRLFFAFGALIAVASLWHPSTRSQPPSGVDYILVVDTSMSMIGQGEPGARNIFPDVKKAVGNLISRTRNGDSLTIYTFDRDTRPLMSASPTIYITADTNKGEVLGLIYNLNPQGNRTHTGQGLQYALRTATELKNKPDAANRKRVIVLFTDGREDVRGIEPYVPIPSNVKLAQDAEPYIYLVSLGETHETELDELKEQIGGEKTKVIRDPTLKEIQTLSEEIELALKATPTPTPVPTPLQISLNVTPASLNFGDIEPGAQTKPQTLNVRSNAAVSVSSALEDGAGTGIELVEPKQSINLNANEETTIKVRLAAASGATDGARALRLVLTPGSTEANAVVNPATVKASVTVFHVPIWRKVLKWAAIFAILLLLLITAYSLFRGKPPWELLADFKKRNHLEGTFEIIRPAPAQAEDAYIDLARLETDRALISGIVPGGATADSDAELTAPYKNGSKLVQLRRTQGVVRVNQAEIAVTELYEGDLVELGDARIRFNWLGHERPVPPGEEV